MTTHIAPRFISRSTTILALALLCAASLLIAGCGSSSDSGAKADTNAVASLDHVDGTITVTGATLSLTPKSGPARDFTLGPAVDQGSVKALELSGERSRVLFRPGKDIAVRVEPAPKAGAGAKTYTGIVTKVSATSLTVDGDDGPLTFAIEPQDAEAMDTPHLKEHKQLKEGITVYYRPTDADGQHAVAYEDSSDYKK